MVNLTSLSPPPTMATGIPPATATAAEAVGVLSLLSITARSALTQLALTPGKCVGLCDGGRATGARVNLPSTTA